MGRAAISAFRKKIFEHYRAHGRVLPWRRSRDPFRVLVSEFMLQQTQVARVLVKYKEFIKRFPTFHALARAPLRDVLAAWQGLGYNRRALALKRTAEIIVRDFQGHVPRDAESLISLPGIGPGTAGAIQAFAFNMPAVFVETNIRSVFLHFFFSDRTGVSDRRLFPYIESALDRGNPREWYYALMDYGVLLKSKVPNPSRRGKSYRKQSAFTGSVREKRAKIVRSVLRGPGTTRTIASRAGLGIGETQVLLDRLASERFFARKRKTYRIA